MQSDGKGFILPSHSCVSALRQSIENMNLAKFFIAAYFTETMPQIKAALSTMILYTDYARNARQFSPRASLRYRNLLSALRSGIAFIFVFADIAFKARFRINGEKCTPPIFFAVRNRANTVSLCHKLLPHGISAQQLQIFKFIRAEARPFL